MSVTRPKGFVAAGVHCGIKADDLLDLALVATADGVPVPAAAVFTSNRVQAAPVLVTRDHLEATGGYASAVVLNSGNANAATGVDGLAHAEQTCAAVAKGLDCAPENVLVCSTGLIGIPFPIDAVLGGVEPLLAAKKGDVSGGERAARAILTTDTRVKETAIGVGLHTVGGMAKGAAMLAPNLATMLAVLTTDATSTPEQLQRALRAAVAETFNALSVDGSTSTNDTVIVLASGKLGKVADRPLTDALTLACGELAEQMADDAEGATKVATIKVQGAASDEDARRAARRIAESQLVQCSLHGADPYWGRIVSEAGSSGAAFSPDQISVAYGGTVVCRNGVALDHDRTAVAAHLAGRMVEVTVDLGAGDGRAGVLTTDLSPGYIAENMRTS
ncbi:MAG: bifunctional glutamate N-acetyltransferase/amino-acid acetyltransferase ArgJ [Actinomycetota bacterium]|nr:bifunctional glutamate N-acetyltransferase/amino-acid acetyltransferase ArgJ [Actinomycetota bacterium]